MTYFIIWFVFAVVTFVCVRRWDVRNYPRKKDQFTLEQLCALSALWFIAAPLALLYLGVLWLYEKIK